MTILALPLHFSFRRWPRALNRQSDFGAHKDWFVKDSMLFTPPATSFECSPTLTNCLPHMRDTGFGCKEIVSFRITGEFTFPGAAPAAAISHAAVAESFDHLKVNTINQPDLCQLCELEQGGLSPQTASSLTSDTS